MFPQWGGFIQLSAAYSQSYPIIIWSIWFPNKLCTIYKYDWKEKDYGFKGYMYTLSSMQDNILFIKYINIGGLQRRENELSSQILRSHNSPGN